MSQVSYKQEFVAGARRVVIKIGSAVVSDAGGLRPEIIARLAAEIDAVVRAGREVVVVTSGAIAAGRARLEKLGGAGVAARQAAAATGQIELMGEWARAFGAVGRTVAQLLLTHQDLAERARRSNAIHTIQTLLEAGVIPIVNENDTVAVEEIRMGDNDVLSSLVAGMAQAQLLVILSDVDGVLTGDPRKRPEAQLIPLITDPEAGMRGLVADSAGPLGSGGMATKLKAAQQAARAGIPVIIANQAQEPQTLDRICAAPRRRVDRRPRRRRGIAKKRPQPAALGHPRGRRRVQKRRLRKPARSRRGRVRPRAGQLSRRRYTEGEGQALQRYLAYARLQGRRRDHPSRQLRADRRTGMNRSMSR
jgi:glutamate 5-kinase